MVLEEAVTETETGNKGMNQRNHTQPVAFENVWELGGDSVKAQGKSGLPDTFGSVQNDMNICSRS